MIRLVLLFTILLSSCVTNPHKLFENRVDAVLSSHGLDLIEIEFVDTIEKYPNAWAGVHCQKTMGLVRECTMYVKKCVVYSELWWENVAVHEAAHVVSFINYGLSGHNAYWTLIVVSEGQFPYVKMKGVCDD